MRNTRTNKYSSVLKNFVYTIYTPSVVSKLINTSSFIGLVKSYLEQHVQHGANLYKELEAAEGILLPNSSSFQIKKYEDVLSIWMEKILNERKQIKQLEGV